MKILIEEIVKCNWNFLFPSAHYNLLGALDKFKIAGPTLGPTYS